MSKWKSILQDEPESCYICGYKAHHKHHCVGGTARRKLAEKDGLYVRLCVQCHQDLHDHSENEIRLKRIAQIEWMEHYHKTEEEWRERYIKSYL